MKGIQDSAPLTEAQYRTIGALIATVSRIHRRWFESDIDYGHRLAKTLIADGYYLLNERDTK